MTSTETIGLFGRPAAPPALDDESPYFVKIDRWRGYPANPFDRSCKRRLPGASSIGKPLDDNSGMLKNWAAKITREVAADLRKTTATMTKAETLEVIKAEANQRMDRGRLIGNDVHLVTANLDAGRPIDVPAIFGKWDGEAEPLLAAWEQFKQDFQPKWGAIERTGYTGPLADNDPETEVAGTIDRICTFASPPISAELAIRPHVDMVVLDIKTKADKTVNRVAPYPSHKVQAHALGKVRALAFEAERDLMALPAPIKAIGLVYLCKDGYQAFFDMADQPFMVKTVTSCARLWHVERDWTQTTYGTPAVGYLEEGHAFPTVIDWPQPSPPVFRAEDPSVQAAPLEPLVRATKPETDPDPEPEPAASTKPKRTRSTTKKTAGKKPATKTSRASKTADGSTQEEPAAATTA
ncbi:hypothetical protein [Stomatohabitans albus]|uniref:hypothetical protein n=1 Tax=Stomatohabitans albus TaxID=3110766 RepID=UPI00300C2555